MIFDNNLEAFKNIINSADEAAQYCFLLKSPKFMELIENPSEELQLRFLEKARVPGLSYIKNPSQKVIIEAISISLIDKTDFNYVKYVGNDKLLQTLAITQKMFNLGYISKNRVLHKEVIDIAIEEAKYYHSNCYQLMEQFAYIDLDKDQRRQLAINISKQTSIKNHYSRYLKNITEDDIEFLNTFDYEMMVEAVFRNDITDELRDSIYRKLMKNADFNKDMQNYCYAYNDIVCDKTIPEFLHYLMNNLIMRRKFEKEITSHPNYKKSATIILSQIKDQA